MGELNYLVIEIYPMGGQRIIAQFGQIDDALLLLKNLVLEYSHPSNLFAIRTINVTGSESIHRYQNESVYMPKEEEKEDD